MNILITGGTGFIGSRLALRCISDGHKVRVFGQENTDAEKANKGLVQTKGAEIILGSITDTEKLSDAVKGIDTVFHLAAAQHEANVPDQVFRDVNVAGTKNLLDRCLDAGVRQFVHGSTIGVYGSLEGKIDEQSPCNPDNIYGITKLEGEKLALSYSNRLPVVAIRIPEIYGPGDRRLLKLFRAINKKSFFVIGNGKNLHHLLYVDDLIEGLLLAADSERAVGEVILLAGKNPIPTDEMARTIAKELGASMPKFHLPLFPFMGLAVIMEKCLCPLGIQPPLHRRRMDFFKKSFSLEISRARELLGFAPKTDFETGVARTAQWYVDQGLLKGGKKEARDGRGQMIVDPDLTAKIEPFDTFWEAPEDIEKGYGKFAIFYKRNYLRHLPHNKNSQILVVSCGAGYFLDLLHKEGYNNVLGIDSDPQEISYAQKRGLNCQLANAFSYLRGNRKPYDLIFGEQEINHLTKPEILEFLDLCHKNLTDGGLLIIHSLNGANPITGSEALAQNFNHFNTFTEYSLRQILEYSGFSSVKVFPLNLYVFYNNPLNYVGLVIDRFLSLSFRLLFIFYGKDNKIFSKKIAGVGIKRGRGESLVSHNLTSPC